MPDTTGLPALVVAELLDADEQSSLAAAASPAGAGNQEACRGISLAAAASA